jgi:hypothetical protein
MVKWAWSTGTDWAASLNRLDATSIGTSPKPPPIWLVRPTRQSNPARALGTVRPHYWRHDPAASVRTAAAHGFRPHCEFLHPRASPTASSRLVTLIPSPLWPIDEAKSLSSSFPRSHPLLCSTCRCHCRQTTSTSITGAAPSSPTSTPRVVTWHRAAGRQATPWSEPMPSPSTSVSTSLRADCSGPHRCSLGLPPHRAHLTGISNCMNNRLMDPSPVPPSGRSCATVSNHVGSDSSSTGDQIKFHAPPACSSA